MSGFDGQIVFVTGAAPGIGLGIARAFHGAGVGVVLGDLREDALDQARATFPEQERPAFVPVDVRDAAAVARFVATAEQGFGPPAVMVANAGIVPNKSVLTMDVSDWDAAIETNLRGVFLSCQAAARSIVAHGTRGRIVTISSIADHVERLVASAYCASKAGVVMFTKVLAMELAEHRINVNSVAPGVIEIPQRASQPSGRSAPPSTKPYRGDATARWTRWPKQPSTSVPLATSTSPARSCPSTAAWIPGGRICRTTRPSGCRGRCGGLRSTPGARRR